MNYSYFLIFQNIFTLKGYVKAFELCEKDSDVFSNVQSNIGGDVNEDILKRELKDENQWESAKALFHFWEKLCVETKLTEEKDYIKYVEIFSLLENVFRNVLIRPYIPAYRTINMNCGRYRSFVTKSEEGLFKNLGFNEDSPNQLTYQEKDSSKTVIYAITCSVFWHVLRMKLNKRSTSL